MATLRLKGDKRKFAVLDRLCIGRDCLQPGTYQHRGATMSGSRNTGSYSDCCMYRAYRGCPLDNADRYSKELAAQRKTEGYRNQRDY